MTDIIITEPQMRAAFEADILQNSGAMSQRFPDNHRSMPGVYCMLDVERAWRQWCRAVAWTRKAYDD